MDHKKELLASRIAKIHDPVQKRLLQDVLVDVFDPLLTYNEESFARLEQKIDGERKDPDSHYYIHTGVCKKDGIDSASRSFFEVFTKGRHSEGCLGTLFLACDHIQVKKCLSGTYRARVETDQGEYLTTVFLTYCQAYQEVIYELYRHFLANRRRWHTINCPFLYKFLDIRDQEGVVPKDAVILKVSVDLGEFSDFVIDDAALVWNLSEQLCKPKVEVQAAGNLSYYAHRILLEDSQSGYLAAPEEEDLFSVVFCDFKGQLLVRTQKEAHPQLKLLKIEPFYEQKDHTKLLYPISTNKRKLRHADRQAMGQPRFLWTKGEVERILGSYEAFLDFELLDVRPDMQGEVEAIDLNPFIRLHSFLKQKRKIAVLLRPKDREDIFCYEKMFFLLSELQLCTDEYAWTGILC